MTALGPYFSAANGINASGQVVGGASYGGTNPHGYAFISGPNGGLYDLNVGEMDASAKAINDAGQVIGESDRGAFITGPNGRGVTYLGWLGASGINASGQVAGWFNSAAGYPHAFITGPDGVGITDLGTLGGNRSEAFGINDAGQVVGQSYGPDGHGYAFITGPNGVGMSYLGALVDLPTGAILTSAADINNMGQVIVSASIVPEPESYALMLAGLALMGAVVRRKQRG
jgi:probable HAF family extracellular repeat protein